MTKKRGRQINIKINLTNRWLYTLIAIGILAIISVGVYAIDTSQAWHPTDQIEGLGTLATKDSVSWTEISNRPAGLDDGDDVGGGLWQTSGDNIYYNDGNIGIGTTTPEAKLDISGDIIITGKIKIVNRYSYKYDWNGRRDGHTSPRCACDTSDYQDCSYDQTYYTNIDYGSACYDWLDIKYAYNTQYRFPVTYGPYVIKTLG